MPVRHSLRVLAVRWIAWTALSRFGRDGVHLVGRLLLARLLWPEAFGLFALAYALVAGLEVLCLLQFEAALVQRPALTAGLRATAHWTVTAAAAAGALLLVGTAEPLAALLGAPGVAPLARALAPWLLLSALGAAARAALLRDLAFRRLALAALTAEVVGTAAAIGAALAGAGVWSLAVHALATEAVELALVWALCAWRPALHWRRRECAELLRFGGPLVGRRALDYAIAHGDRLLVGYVAGPAVLGLYAMALRLSRSASEPIAAIFSRVAFPAFARARDDVARSRRGFHEALRAQAALTVPLVTAIALLADDLVPAILGARWLGAVPLVQILCVRAAAAALNAVPRAALLGRGRQWLVLAMGAVAFAAYGLGWLAGLPWGVAGVAVGGAAAAVATVPVGLALLSRELPVQPQRWAAALWPGAAGGLAVVAGIAAAERWLGPLLASPRARLAVVLLAAAASAAAVLLPWLVAELRRQRLLANLAPDPTPASAPTPSAFPR